MYTPRKVFKVIISVIRVKINVYFLHFDMLLKIAFVGNTFFSQIRKCNLKKLTRNRNITFSRNKLVTYWASVQKKCTSSSLFYFIMVLQRKKRVKVNLKKSPKLALK